MPEDKAALEKLILPRPVDPQFRLSSPFGARVLGGANEFHKGIDFAVPVGTPVKAVAPGFCFRAGWESETDHTRGFGLRVWQAFKYQGRDFYAWYGHLSVLTAKEGEVITEGQIVGLSGNTGRSTGPHLHVQFREKNTSLIYDVAWTTT